MTLPRCLLVVDTRRRRTPIDINGQRRQLRDVEEFDMLRKSRLARHTHRIDALFEQPVLTDRDKRELAARLRVACRIVVVKTSREEIAALSGAQQLALLRAFAAAAAKRPPSCRVPKSARERYAREDAERAEGLRAES